jgi:hypothetical protein
LDVLKKYVEVLNAIYSHYKEKLSTTPVPEVRVAKSMLYLLSRSSPEVPGASAEGFVEPRFINLDTAGFFNEMNRQYAK